MEQRGKGGPGVLRTGQPAIRSCSLVSDVFGIDSATKGLAGITVAFLTGGSVRLLMD